MLTIATALLPIFGTTAKGQIYQTDQVTLNLGANSKITGSMSVAQFDPALGVLDSVGIEPEELMYNSGVTVSGPNGISGLVDATGSISIQDPGNIISSSSTSMYSTWEAGFSLPSSSNTGGANSALYSMGYTYYDSPAVLSEFTGDGSLSFQATGSHYAETEGFPYTASMDYGTLTGSYDVEYIYSVPEPGSFSLLAVGFGIMLTRRTARKLLNR